MLPLLKVFHLLQNFLPRLCASITNLVTNMCYLEVQLNEVGARDVIVNASKNLALASKFSPGLFP